MSPRCPQGVHRHRRRPRSNPHRRRHWHRTAWQIRLQIRVSRCFFTMVSAVCATEPCSSFSAPIGTPACASLHCKAHRHKHFFAPLDCRPRISTLWFLCAIGRRRTPGNRFCAQTGLAPRSLKPLRLGVGWRDSASCRQTGEMRPIAGWPAHAIGSAGVTIRVRQLTCVGQNDF